MFYFYICDHIYKKKCKCDFKMTIFQEINSSTGFYFYIKDKLIHTRQKNGEFLSSPKLVCNDYQKGFSAISHNNSIYYSYINTENKLLVCSTSQPGILFTLDEKDSSFFLETSLFLFQNKLFILFLTQKEKQFQLHLVTPFENVANTEQKLTCNLPPMLHVIATQRSVFILLTNDFEDLAYEMDNQLQLHTYSNSDFETKLQVLQEKLDTLQLEKTELITHIKELTDQNKRLKETNISIATRQKKLENTIESATTQYNQLMEVAQAYRNEAIKWRSKFR